MADRVAAKSLRHPSVLLAACLLGAPASSLGYPIDGAVESGIRRLEAVRAAQEPDSGRRKLPPGARLGVGDIRLSLDAAGSAWRLEDAAKDSGLQAALESTFARLDGSYAVAVVDYSDPETVAWAGLREDHSQYPGSVGKVLVMVGLFDGLRRAFPSPERRREVLRSTIVEAGAWAEGDSHAVPLVDGPTGLETWRPIRSGDAFTLSEWIDHMVSPSANSAGSTVWKEAILLRAFGARYPVDRATEDRFFASTPRTELQALALAVLQEPLAAAGLEVANLRQGSFFTRSGKARVPGVRSHATPRELVKLLVALEQGRLVDAWSSLEMKRYLYLTKKRYRYAYPRELHEAAVYFKSGSLYRCAPEEGFRCGKYRGNVDNFMNSVAIVESPAGRGEGQRRYAVALMSNVLRKNSAWDHARLAAAIEAAIRTRQAQVVEERGSEAELGDAGRSH